MDRKNGIIFLIGLVAVCLLAPIRLDIGPVGFTLQTFIIFTVAALLNARLAALLTTVYILIGSFGLPIFGGYTSGVEKLTGYTAGFIWGFIPVAAFVGWACNRGPQSFFHYIVHFFRAHILLLIPGLLVLYFTYPGVDIWATLIRLLPGLLVKTILGGILAYSLKKKLLPNEAEA